MLHLLYTFYMFMREYNFVFDCRKVVKATLLLLPLLGITYLLFLYSPTDDKAVVEAHKFINTFLQSFQVFILMCSLFKKDYYSSDFSYVWWFLAEKSRCCRYLKFECLSIIFIHGPLSQKGMYSSNITQTLNQIYNDFYWMKQEIQK